MPFIGVVVSDVGTPLGTGLRFGESSRLNRGTPGMESGVEYLSA